MTGSWEDGRVPEGMVWWFREVLISIVDVKGDALVCKIHNLQNTHTTETASVGSIMSPKAHVLKTLIPQSGTVGRW